MERMTTCFEKLLKKLNPQTDDENPKNKKRGVPEDVLGAVAVAVSYSLHGLISFPIIINTHHSVFYFFIRL